MFVLMGEFVLMEAMGAKHRKEEGGEVRKDVSSGGGGGCKSG